MLPLAVTTAACGLYQPEHLTLPTPTKDAARLCKTVLIWGAAPSVSCVAVQLANESGFDVIATASKRNFDFVKSVGAKAVFDHSSSSVEDDLVKALKEGEFAGVFEATAKPESLKISLQAASHAGGGRLAPVLSVPKELLPENITMADPYSKFRFR